MRLLQWMMHGQPLFVGIGGTLGDSFYMLNSSLPISTTVDSLLWIGEGGSVVHSAVMVSFTWTNGECIYTSSMYCKNVILGS